ncbi:Scn10a [Symbiodinium microadriaticum]|nr:Scn10a [Symbiodinium microadriaticum]
MPTPAPSVDQAPEIHWMEFQTWFLAILDLKFSQQEAVLRGILESRPPLPPTPALPLPRRVSMTEKHARSPTSPRQPQVFEVKLDQEISPAGDDLERSSQAKKRMTTLGVNLMSEKMQPEPPVKHFVKTKLDLYMGGVVLINMIFMVVMTQWTGSRAEASLGLIPDPWPFFTDAFFDVSEYCFFSLYVADVVFRLLVLRREWYFDPSEGYMYLNMFDACLVCVSTFELLLLPAIFSAGGNPDIETNTIRVLKLIRIVRTLRIFKTVSVFRQLRLLVSTCIASIGALFWSMILLLLLNIAFALMMAQALQTFILDEEADLDTRVLMNQYYGSFTLAFYTIFEVTHSGSWPSRVCPVLDLVDPWYAALFLPYIAMVVFAVIRVVTALFIKETLASAANDAELVIEETRRNAVEYQEKLEELFQIVDDDGDGHLTPQEFVEAMSLPSVQQYMKFLDVSVRDVRPLFDILSEGDGLITIAEFCKGLMQLKGQARALDIVILQHENSKLMRQCNEIYRAICDAAAQCSPCSPRGGTWSPTGESFSRHGGERKVG